MGKDLRKQNDNSLDFLVLAVGSRPDRRVLYEYLADCRRVLGNEGVLFVQGTPDTLSEFGVFLDGRLTFRYWIAVESTPVRKSRGLPSAHCALMLFTRESSRFSIRQTRMPHQLCSYCGRSLKNWGGKTHLMHPNGVVISDVWTHLPPVNDVSGVFKPILDTIIQMLDFQKPDSEVRGLVGTLQEADPPSVGRLSTIMPTDGRKQNELSPAMVNVIHCGDAVSILRQYPNNSIDLAFADPPYNLRKSYGPYQDGWSEQEYVSWCNKWLAEYVRILKPSGALYVLNLPRWTMHHSVFLDQHMHLQNWIVWNALSEPRGKIMPAHYGLLFYTRHPTDFTFNYEQCREVQARDYCLRDTCVEQRMSAGDDRKEDLTDIWSGIHRIRHKRDRDYHPCQLPDALPERIIRLSSNEDDIVLDAFSGVGTTPVAAARLGRRYVGIDINEEYVAVTREKLQGMEQSGRILRQPVRKPHHPFTKKELQLELRSLACQLGRLPLPEDIERMSKYGLDTFTSVFPSWSKALKAAKLEITDPH